MTKTYLFRVWGMDRTTGQPAHAFRRPWLRSASGVSQFEAHQRVRREFMAEFPGLRWVVELADVTTVRMVSAWCARVIGAYAIAHKGGA